MQINPDARLSTTEASRIFYEDEIFAGVYPESLEEVPKDIATEWLFEVET
jgi:hypothetical protein